MIFSSNITPAIDNLIWVYNKNLDFIKQIGGCSNLQITAISQDNEVKYITALHHKSGNSINLLLEDFNVLWFNRNPEKWDSRG